MCFCRCIKFRCIVHICQVFYVGCYDNSITLLDLPRQQWLHSSPYYDLVFMLSERKINSSSLMGSLLFDRVIKKSDENEMNKDNINRIFAPIILNQVCFNSCFILLSIKF